MSAIQSDVQTEQQNDAPGNTPNTDNTAAAPVKTARELAMEAIEARHHEQAAAENGYNLQQINDGDGDDAAAAQLAAQMAAATNDASSNTAATAATAPAAAPAAAPSTVHVKVDGQELDVPLDEMVRQYQKNASADKRLAEATRLLREAQEREAQSLLQQQQAATAAVAANTAPNPAEEQNTPEPALAESGKEFLKALFEGDEENALNALQKVMQGRPAQPVAVAPTLDVNQITANVAQQVQYQMAVDRALDANRRDYPELYADPDVEELAAAKIHGLRQQGVDFFTALNTVSNDFAKKFQWGAQRTEPGRPAEVTPPTTTTTRDAKLANKQGIDNVTSVSTKTVNQDDVPPTTSSVIAEMRAARGGGG